MGPNRFLLDGNIYDLLAVEAPVQRDILALIRANRAEIVATPVVIGELRRSHFGGLPNWFPVNVVPEAIAISGLARSGIARSSAGKMYRLHLGQSQKGRDAILAHSAHSIGATLVSEDRRCRERLRRLVGVTSALTYHDFRMWLRVELTGGAESEPD